MKKIVFLMLSAVLVLTACGETEKTTEVGGEITVVTSFTDAEERFSQVESKFIEMNPDVTDIIWESTGSDYDEYITTRMTSGDYGDVLLVPFSLTSTPEQLGEFLYPIGETKDLSKVYKFTDQAAFEESTYALPISVNTLGLIYNEDVFTNAGVKEMPTSSEDMYKACESIQTKTKSKCWYSNLNSMPMLWTGALTSYGGEQYPSEILNKKTIVEEGQPHREILDFAYNMISKGYSESDPLTGDYMQSEQLIADGEYGFMVMGSQSLSSIQSKSKNPDSIKMMPFPVKFNDTMSMPIGADELIGISKNSDNIGTSEAFLEFLLSPESGFAYANGGFSPQIEGNDAAPEYLAYQLTDYPVIRTIPTEPLDVTKEYNELAASANVSSMSALLTDLIGIATNDGDYDAYIEKISKDWEAAISDQK